MGLLDLIANLGAKQTTIYSEFLDAYNRLRQLKDIKENLTTITKCLISELNTGRRRCFDYIVAHNADKTILQLQETIDTEDFFIALFESSSEEYLTGEFVQGLWRYGSFPRVTVALCKISLARGILLPSLAKQLILSLSSGNSEILASLGMLYSSPDYIVLFNEFGLGPNLIKITNAMIEKQSDRAFELISLLCCYEEMSGFPLIESVKLNISKLDRAIHDFGCLEFFAEVFEKTKFFKFRKFLISELIVCVMAPQFPDFLVKCIVADPCLMASMLSERIKKAEWSAVNILRIILFQREPKRNLLSDYNKSYAVIADEMGHAENETSSNIKIESIKEIFKSARRRIQGDIQPMSFSLLGYLLEGRMKDERIYYFLYLTNKITFYTRIKEILEVCENKAILIDWIYEDILLGDL